MYIEIIPNRKSRPAYLLREARHEGRRIVKRTVAKAGPAAEAKRKKRTMTSKSGFVLRDWRGVMSALGTQCLTTIEAGGIPVTMETESNAYQAEVFRLLAAESPTWGVPSKRNVVEAARNAPDPLK